MNELINLDSNSIQSEPRKGASHQRRPSRKSTTRIELNHRMPDNININNFSSAGGANP